jgi:hypothetical protein
MELVTVFFNAKSSWFYIWLGLSCFLMLVWYFMVREFVKNTYPRSKYMLFTVYVILYLVEQPVFLKAVRKQPVFEFGNYFAIVVPTIAFYVLLGVVLIILIWVLSTEQFGLRAFRRFVPGFYTMGVWQLNYAWGHGSVTGLLMGALMLYFVKLQASFLPTGETKAKEE